MGIGSKWSRARLLAVVVIATVALFTLASTAWAATFENVSPVSGTVRTVTQNVTFSAGVTASSGRTLSAIATLSVAGGQTVAAQVSWPVIGQELVWFDENGEQWQAWVDVYDKSKATVTATAMVLSAHTAQQAVLTVTEVETGQLYSYTWTFPEENCKSCHGAYPGAHDPAILGPGTCATCHASTGPAYEGHGGTAGTSCGTSLPCHRVRSHDMSRLTGWEFWGITGEWDEPRVYEENTCSRCHTGGYAGITQITGAHGDYTAAHLAAWEPECANQCHGADLVETHAGNCATCHPDGGPDPAAGTTCFDCHVTYHDKATSTPASSSWSLALIAVVGLAAVPVIRRAKATR